jgi:hypothetical protein
MKTRLFVLIACIAVGAGILSGCLNGNDDPTEEEQPVEESRGTGTATDPYIITTAQHLSDLRNYPGKEHAGTHFKLGKDIEVSSFSEQTWGEEGWDPIGSSSNRFYGQLDGDGHKVTGLWINRSTTRVGLFSNIGDDGVIEHLGVEVKTRNSVKGSDRVGILAGDNDGSIANCYANGIVTGNDNVGGLVGSNYGTVTNCYAIGEVSGTDEVGGLVGWNHAGITNCYATGKITGDDYVGGLVGWNAGNITTSYANSDVVGSGDEVGGLAGLNSSGTITNCYATGNITGSSFVGGFVGTNHNSISTGYSTGAVKGNSSSFTGGFVGWCSSISSTTSSTSITNCYFLKETGGVNSSLSGVGSNDGSATVTAQTATQMKTKSRFSGFNFTTVWRINESASYPYLRDIEANVENPPGK